MRRHVKETVTPGMLVELRIDVFDIETIEEHGVGLVVAVVVDEYSSENGRANGARVMWSGPRPDSRFERLNANCLTGAGQ